MANSYAIHAGLWGATRLPGLTGAAITVGRQTRLMGNSGTPHRRLVSAGQYNQAVRLSARCLDVLLDKMGASGTAPIPCADINSNGPLVLAAAGTDDVLPQYTAGSTHELMAIARGLACISELSWGGVGEGIDIGLNVWPLSSDGDANAWTLAAGTLPLTPTAEEEYDIHAATWAGNPLIGMTNLRVSFGANPQPIHNPGKLYPTFIRQAPAAGLIEITAQFTLPDRSKLRAFGAHFDGAAIANLVLTCRKFDQAAARTSADERVFTIAGVAEVTDAADGRPGAVNVTVHGVSADGTTSPLSWT